MEVRKNITCICSCCCHRGPKSTNEPKRGTVIFCCYGYGWRNEILNTNESNQIKSNQIKSNQIKSNRSHPINDITMDLSAIMVERDFRLSVGFGSNCISLSLSLFVRQTVCVLKIIDLSLSLFSLCETIHARPTRCPCRRNHQFLSQLKFKFKFKPQIQTSNSNFKPQLQIHTYRYTRSNFFCLP
jgi:hypothetical protein